MMNSITEIEVAELHDMMVDNDVESLMKVAQEGISIANIYRGILFFANI
ncbi:MAG: hypothetical protein OEL79_01860 [Chromatiales bacterium]|nr:hypothetical protein [Chromatiales bacterium]